MENNNNNISGADAALYTVLFVVTIIVWIVLSFTQRRTKKGLKTCDGRPGIVFPVNFLNPRHRLVYVLACGALASQWFGLLTVSSYSTNDVNKWATPIVNSILIMFLVSVVIIITYPILACVEAPIPLVGYIMGAIYCDIYFVLNIYLFAKNLQLGSNLVSNYKPVYYSDIVVSNVPQFICLIGILIWYHYKLIKELLRVYKTGNQWKLAIQEQPRSMNHINYVKQLLQPPKLVNLTFIKKHILTRTKLPFPVLIVAVVVAIIIFQLTVFVCFYFPYLFDQWGDLFEALLEQSPDFKDNTFFSKLPHFFKSLTAISVLSPIFATILCCVLFIHFIYCLRLYIKGLHSTSKSDLISQINWPSLTLSSSVRYAGYQIAAFITAWILYTVVIFVIGLALMGLIFIPSIFGYYYYRMIVIVSWVILIVGTQMIICKLFFVSKDSADLKTVIIDNRRAFNMFSYIVLLYNMATGLMTAIIRVGLSFLFMIMILPRMDRIMYLRGFEKFDLSHGTFKNFILIDALLQNPIVHVFVDTLTIANKAVSTIKRPLVSQKAYNRWFVTYTLIKNPQLAKSFKRNEQMSVQDPLFLDKEASVIVTTSLSEKFQN